MPPLAIGAAAFAASMAAGALVTTAIMIGSMAMTASMYLLAKKPGSGASQSDRKQTLRSSNAPKLASVGKTQAAGVLFFVEEQPGSQTKNEWIYLGLAIAGHEIESVDEIWLGDKKLSEFNQSNVHIVIHNNPSTVSQYMKDNCPSWKDDMIGKGIVWAEVGLRFNTDEFSSGIPNIQFVRRGAKLYDPRTGRTEYSNNSALVWLWYMTEFMSVPMNRIDLELVKEQANICDEVITNQDGTTEKRYTCNGVFDYSESAASVMNDILATCAARPTYIGGRHGLLVGAYRGPATLEIRENQIVEDVELSPETAHADYCNTVTGTFVDPNQNYSETDFPHVSIDALVQEDGMEVTTDLKLKFVTSHWQAQRLANIQLQKLQYSRVVSLTMNMSGYGYVPGMYAKLYMPSLGIDGYEFMIDEWSFSGDNGAKITLIECPREVYDDAIGKPLERSNLTTLTAGGVPAPSNLRFTSEATTDIVQGVLRWQALYPQANSYAVVITRRADNAVMFTANVPIEECYINGLQMGDYNASVVTIGLIGRSQPSVLLFSIAKPGAPDGVTVTPNNWGVELVPYYNGPSAYGTLFEFYMHTTQLAIANVESTATRLGIAGHLSINGLNTNTNYYFWVRAVNNYGKSAFVAVATKTTQNSGSVLDLVKGSISADHLVEDLREPIKEVATIGTEISSIKGSIDVITNKSIPDLQKGFTHLESIVTGGDGGFIQELTTGLKQAIDMSEDAAKAALEAATSNTEDVKRKDTILAQIKIQQLITVNEQEAQAKEIRDFNTRFGGVEASIHQETEARSTALEGVAKQINQLTTSIGANAAAIQAETSARSTADSAMASQITTIQAATASNAAQIKDEATTRASETSSLSSRVAITEAQGRDNAAKISSESTARQSADGALGQRIDTVTAQAGSIASQVSTEVTARTQGDTALGDRIDKLVTKTDQTAAAVTQESQTRAAETSSLGSQITTIQANVGSNVAAIQAEAKARADQDGIHTSNINTLTANLGATSAKVNTTAEAVANVDGKVSAGWYTKASVNGITSGFGLRVDLSPDGTVMSAFVIDADTFQVMSKATPTGKRPPFVIQNGTAYINHALMDTAEIHNLIAQYAKVTTLDSVTINSSVINGGTINSVNLNGSNISGGNININNGAFTVDGQGNLHANNGSFGGQVQAAQVQGSIYAKVMKVYQNAWGSNGGSMAAGTVYSNNLASIGAENFDRVVYISDTLNGIGASGHGSGMYGGVIAEWLFNGVVKSKQGFWFSSGTNAQMWQDLEAASFKLPAGSAGTLSLRLTITSDPGLGGATGLWQFSWLRTDCNFGIEAYKDSANISI